MLLEDFGDDWDSRVDWVRDHKHESLGCGGGNPSGEIADDSGIDLSVAGWAAVNSRVFYVHSGAERVKTHTP